MYIHGASNVTRKVNFRLPDELVDKADVAADYRHKLPDWAGIDADDSLVKWRYTLP
jgi:hypothetical protein